MNQKYIITWVIIILVIVVAGYLVFFGGEQKSVLDEEPNGTTEKVVEVDSMEVNYHEDVTGYLVEPQGEGPYPALVLIHEWWGVTEDVRAMARDFAREGYVALVVDLYEGESTDSPERARELVGEVRGDMDRAFANLESAVSYLESLENIDSESLASVGWCFGGGWAYEMAVNDLGVDASVMYYGQFDLEDDYQNMRASILGHFGEEDMSIAVDNVREFQAALQTAGGEHDVYIYPNVGHGFANYRGGDNLEYDKESAEVAWQRTLEFLSEALE